MFDFGAPRADKKRHRTDGRTSTLRSNQQPERVCLVLFCVSSCFAAFTRSCHGIAHAGTDILRHERPLRCRPNGGMLHPT